MRQGRRIPKAAAVVAVLAMATAAWADGMIVPVRPDVPVTGQWSVQYHHVDITVRDQVASVSIDQKFVNDGRGMIEVEYFFPVPPGAAIDSMTLMVDGKEYAARLLKADEARRLYEDIVARKKDPALLEYAGGGLYRTRAFPLNPGKPVRVAVTYKGICRRTGGAVEVWYPLNTEKFSARAIDDVRVTVDVRAQSPISTVYSPRHDLKWEHPKKDPRHIVATYQARKVLPTTDFQLFYTEEDRGVGATLLSHQPVPGEDGYFTLLVSPAPQQEQRKVIAKDVVLLYDRSGSMSGEKIRQARGALEYVLENLNPSDRFAVVAYNDAVEPLTDGLRPAQKADVRAAVERIGRLGAQGGTNIYEALATALGVLGEDAERPGYVIFLTDGKPTVYPAGADSEADILKNTAKANTGGARLFAFGVGYDVNVQLLDRLVRDHGGRSEYAKPGEDIERRVSALYAKIRHPVMTGVAMRIDGVEVRQMYPGEIGDVFDGEQVVVVGRYDAAQAAKLPRGEGPARQATLVLTGMYLGREHVFEYPVEIAPPAGDPTMDFVETLWAVRRVGYLLDQIQLHGETEEVVDELIRLSKTYGIMTPYTSFLADETTRLADADGLRSRGRREAGRLAKSATGGAAQNDAVNRARLNEAVQLAPAEAPAGPDGERGGVVQYGNTTTDKYEAGEVEVVRNVRQVGNQAVYQRGKVWVAANAADVDPETDRKNVQVVQRFSEAYFRLARANTVQENRLLATQRADEKLLVRLRGQAYLIE